jgi:hypothetical protein
MRIGDRYAARTSRREQKALHYTPRVTAARPHLCAGPHAYAGGQGTRRPTRTTGATRTEEERGNDTRCVGAAVRTQGLEQGHDRVRVRDNAVLPHLPVQSQS